jgi:hypothetical protein
MKESERLVSSCPRETYTMTARDFGGRWGAVENIALRMYIAINNELAKLQMVDAFRAMVPYQQTLSSNMTFDAYYKGHESGSYHAWSFAGKMGHPPAWPKGEDPEEVWEPDEDERDPTMERDGDEIEAELETYGKFLPEVLDKMERELATSAYSLWEGFSAFCGDVVGVVDAEKVAAVILEPVADRVGGIEARAARLGLEKDADAVEEIREGARGGVARPPGAGRLMGRFRGRLRRLEREMETELVPIEHEDGIVSRWPLGDDLFGEVFLHEHERGNRHFKGEDPGPAHPFVVALRTAANLEALMSEQGTMLGFWVGEDEIIRGLRERPGPPVE